MNIDVARKKLSGASFPRLAVLMPNRGNDQSMRLNIPFPQHSISASPFLVSAVEPSRHHQLGMTLIEIMIALLIGAFLLGGVLQVFVASKQTNRMQENLSRLQENGRFALDFMARDIRMTSYWACLRRASGDIAGSNDNAVAGDNIDDGTDTITLKAAFATTPTGICGTSVSTTAAYYTNATSTIVYSIDNAVLRKNTNGQNNELIEGVENMQILYGEDTDADGGANYYVSANTVVNMDNVISIRISLLIRSLEDNIAAQPLAYTYNGATITPTDRRLRRVFNATIAVRNRLP